MLKWLLGRSPWEIAATLFVVFLDLVHWLVFEPVNDALRSLLSTPSVLSILLLIALYFAYCVALILLALLKPESGDKPATWQKVLFLYPSFGFGIIVVMAGGAVGGMMSDDSVALSDGWQQAGVFGTLALFFVHIMAVAIPIKPRLGAEQPGYLLLLAPAMVVSELMLNLSVALWYHFLGPEAGPAPDEPSTVGSFIIALPLFLLFFAAPRFTFMSRSFTWTALASGLGFALYELWHMVAEAPLL